MFRSDLHRVLMRRWYLVLAGVLATVGLCAAATKLVPVTYEAKADVLLVPGQSGTPGSNPFLAVGGQTAPADILARAMSDASTAAAISKAGSTGSYNVTRDLTTNGPMVEVVAKADSAASTLQTLKAVVARLEPTMQRLQDNVTPPVPVRSRITTEPILVDNAAGSVRKSQLRAVLVAGAAGLIGTVFFISLLDGFLSRRRSAAADPRAADPDAPTRLVRPLPAGETAGLAANPDPSDDHLRPAPLPRHREHPTPHDPAVVRRRRRAVAKRDG